MLIFASSNLRGGLCCCENQECDFGMIRGTELLRFLKNTSLFELAGGVCKSRECLFLFFPYPGANAGVSLTGTGVSAGWQLLRSKGVLWYGFVFVYFSTIVGKNGGILAGAVHPGTLWYILI